MKIESRYLAILIVAMVLCLAAWTNQSHDKRIWEYKLLLVDNPPNQLYPNDEKILNQYGADGWELAAINKHGYYLFKRAK